MPDNSQQPFRYQHFRVINDKISYLARERLLLGVIATMHDHLVAEREYFPANVARMGSGGHDAGRRRRRVGAVRHAEVGAEHGARRAIRGELVARLHHHAGRIVKDGDRRRVLLRLIAVVRQTGRVGRLQLPEHLVIQ